MGTRPAMPAPGTGPRPPAGAVLDAPGDAPELGTFGELLRRHRLAAGLTQEALAERAGISVRAVTDLERGVNRTPRAATRRLLAAALQLSASEQAGWEAAARWRPRTAQPALLAAWAQPADAPPLVGRGPELGLLEHHLAGPHHGPPVLLLAGEPGIGKSRLLSEAARLGAALGWRVLQGGCHQRGGHEPYAPVLHALARHVRGASRAQLQAELRGCAWLVRLLPELGRAPIEPLPEGALPPEQERRLMVDAVARFLANVAGPVGTLLLLDDLQWAGDDALDLVRSLAHAAVELPDVPLRLVAAYRHTELPPNDALLVLLADLAAAGRATQRRVGPLAPADAAQLLDGLLCTTNAPREARERTLRRAGGVPFVLISCAEAARAAAAPGEAADDVPWTVAQSIRGRLAALPAQTRELLGPSAVLGRVVARRVLAAAMAWPVEEMLTALEPACRAHLLVEEDAESYRFVHDILREVVADELGAAGRAHWHRRIAEALQAQATQGTEVSAAMLAYHFAGAEVWSSALPYLIRAAEAAASMHAYQDALEWYAQALEVCERLGAEAAPVKLDVLQKRGLIHQSRMHLAEMRAEFERMAATARTTGDRHREALALVHRGTAAWWDHAFAEAESDWRAALATGEGFADVKFAASMFIGHLCLSLGRQDEARQWRRVAARLASAVDDAYFQTAHGVMSSMPLWLAGRFGAAVSRLGRYRAVTRRSGQEILRLQHQWAEALARAGRGEYAAAMTLLHAALEMSKQCGDPFWQGRCLNTLGWIHHELQEFTTALELNQQALQAAQAAPFPDPEVEGNTRLNLGDALLALGRWDDADLQFQAVEQVVRHPRPEEHWMLWRYAQHFFHSAGELALARGQLERAQALADECLAGAEATDSRKNVVKARRLRAQVFLARNQVAAADQEIGQALVLAEPLGNPPQLWRTYVALGEVRRAQDRARDAGAAYRAALGVVERVARGLGDPTLRERFQQSPHVRDIRRRLMERS